MPDVFARKLEHKLNQRFNRLNLRFRFPSNAVRFIDYDQQMVKRKVVRFVKVQERLCDLA